MSDDLSFSGSCERDLLLSKIWLANHLPKRRFGKVYVLGSWYGNIGLIFRLLGVDFDSICNVDVNSYYCKANRVLYKLAGFDRPYEILNQNCNEVDYSDADLVVNVSSNDIQNSTWFDLIPADCLTVIQCRNNQLLRADTDRPASYQEFLDLFPMHRVVYKGQLPLKNSIEQYQRYMLIGYV